jgi:hypothetical protein
MNYLQIQYAFYAINIYLEKVMEDFRWRNACAATRPRARKFSVSATLVLQKAV